MWFFARLPVMVLVGAALAGCGEADPSPRLQVEDAWARPARAGDTGAVYLTIRNTSRVADALLGAQSDAARAAEMHETQTAGNVAQMHAAHRLEIPAGNAVQFKPGGLHIMLVGLGRDLRAGERFMLSLRFEKSGLLAVEVQVRQE